MSEVLDPELVAFAREHKVSVADMPKVLAEVLDFVAKEDPNATPAEKRAMAKGVLAALHAILPCKGIGQA